MGTKFQVINASNYNQKVIESQKDELYDQSFFEYVINARLNLNEEEYERVLCVIAPALASKFAENNKEFVSKLIHTFCQTASEDEKEFIKNMPDDISALDQLFRINLNSFQKEIRENGFEQAMSIYEQTYIFLDNLYSQLPYCYPFSLIRLCEKK